MRSIALRCPSSSPQGAPRSSSGEPSPRWATTRPAGPGHGGQQPDAGSVPRFPEPSGVGGQGWPSALCSASSPLAGADQLHCRWTDIDRVTALLHHRLPGDLLRDRLHPQAARPPPPPSAATAAPRGGDCPGSCHGWDQGLGRMMVSPATLGRCRVLSACGCSPLPCSVLSALASSTVAHQDGSAGLGMGKIKGPVCRTSPHCPAAASHSPECRVNGGGVVTHQIGIALF